MKREEKRVLVGGFGGRVVNELIDKMTTEQKNVWISPLSIRAALAMTYMGANGDTKKEIHNVAEKEQCFETDVATSTNCKLILFANYNLFS